MSWGRVDLRGGEPRTYGRCDTGLLRDDDAVDLQNRHGGGGTALPMRYESASMFGSRPNPELTPT